MSQEPNIPAVDGVQKPTPPTDGQTFADLGLTGPIVGALPSEVGRGPTPFYSGSITSQPINDGTEGTAFGQQAFPVSTLASGIATFKQQFEFGNLSANLIAGARFHYDKEFDPDAVPALVERRKVLIQDLNRRISQSTPGIRAGTFRFGMSALAQLADPLQLAVIAGTDGLLGLGSKAMTEALSEHVLASPRLARVLTGALKGSITTATFGAAQAGSHLAIAHDYEEDYTTLDMLHQTAVYGIFGGVLEGLGGLIHVTPPKPLTKEGTLDEPTTPIQPVNQDDYRTILQSAIAQVSNDNYVDVGALVQQGIKNGRLNDNIEDLPIIAQNLQQLPKDLEAKNAEIQKLQSSIDTRFKSPSDDFPIEDLRADELGERLNTIKEIAPEERTNFENSQLKELPKIGIVSQTADILQRNPFLREDSENKFIDRIAKGKEKDILTTQNLNLSRRLNQLTSLEKTTQKSIGISDKEISHLTKTTRMPVTKVRALIESNKNRIKQIEKTPSITQKLLKEQTKKLVKLKADRDLISTQLEANQVGADLMLQRIPPVSALQANDLGRAMFSTEGESPFTPHDDSLSREVSKESDEPSTLLKDDEENVDQKLADGELNEDDTDLINEVNEELKLQEGYTKLIKSITNCLSEKAE